MFAGSRRISFVVRLKNIHILMISPS
jgi:hypothetical protein